MNIFRFLHDIYKTRKKLLKNLNKITKDLNVSVLIEKEIIVGGKTVCGLYVLTEDKIYYNPGIDMVLTYYHEVCHLVNHRVYNTLAFVNWTPTGEDTNKKLQHEECIVRLCEILLLSKLNILILFDSREEYRVHRKLCIEYGHYNFKEIKEQAIKTYNYIMNYQTH